MNCPQESSGMKHVRADKKKRDRNLRRKSALRTALKQTEAAIADGEMGQAQELYRRGGEPTGQSRGERDYQEGHGKSEEIPSCANDINKIATA